MTPKSITRIRVTVGYESCERWTYYVELTTDEGFTMTPNGHVTGSVYAEGLTRQEARDRALIDAHNWSDFLGLPVEPFVEDGVTHEPEMTFDFYQTRRDLADRDA